MINIPVNGIASNLRYKPCRQYLMCSNYNATINDEENTIITKLTLNNKDIRDSNYVDNAIENHISRIKRDILSQLGNLLPELKIHNYSIKNYAKNETEKLIKAIKDKRSAAEISTGSKYLKIVPKETVPIKIEEKKIVTTYKEKGIQIPLETNIKTLSQESFLSIFNTIIEYSKYVERNPKSYQFLDEEGIRDQIINALNLKLDTANATGETFNVNGKTDIIIMDNKDICYIAECKIWKGEKYLEEALIQLFGYTSSDVSYISILIFNKNKQYINEKVIEFIIQHEKYIKTIKDSRFIFKHPANDKMNIELSVVIFNIHGNK